MDFNLENAAKMKIDHLHHSIELKKAGRKPLDTNRIDVSDPKFKRKEQNRVAQRAFRERKQKLFEEMQEQIANLQKEKREREAELLAENDKLKTENELLKQEIRILKHAYSSRFDINTNMNTNTNTNKIPLQSILDTSDEQDNEEEEVSPEAKRRLHCKFSDELNIHSLENPAPFSFDPFEKDEEMKEENMESNNVLRCAPENKKPCKLKVLTVLERAKGAGRRVNQVQLELKSYCPEFNLDTFCQGLKRKVNLDPNHIITDEDINIYIDYINRN